MQETSNVIKESEIGGKLFIVATPIGNLGDISYRAVETLKSVDLIACEDTRQTAKLLQHYAIARPLISYHQHSKITKVEQIIGELKQGKNIALVSDAGTPGVSDPGQVLINSALSQGISVVPIPGACALVAGWQASGLLNSRFAYYGFLPHKKGRQTLLKQISLEDKPVILYESCHRILKLLSELAALGDPEVIVAKELTKIHETFFRGKASQIKIAVPRGEYVVIIHGTAKLPPRE